MNVLLRSAIFGAAILSATPFSFAQTPSLFSETTIKAISGELSGIKAKRNLDRVTLYHRTRASTQFREAAEFVQAQLTEYGFENAVIREYSADGKTMFGTQKSRPAWEVEFAELWELSEVDGTWVRQRRLADWSAMPMSLAQDSLSADVTTGLVDVGKGTSEQDYFGKDVEGQLVLTSSQPSAIQSLAVGQLGAAGIISYAPNQRSAWWKEDDRLVRWGHLSSFPDQETFGFMVSLGEARRLQARLASGEPIKFHAVVDARQYEGEYTLVDAVIEGTDRLRGDEEIVFTCHLDHPRPGANDNASGCVAILEVARTLNKLIESGQLPTPRRSLRFIWPAEIEGSLIYLNDRADTHKIKANIHLDMVGGSPETKAVFRVSGGPMSTPSFISDIGHEVGRFVNEQTEAYASGLDVSYPLVSPEGGKEPLMALMEGLNMGSDHQIFNEGSWSIPGIYLHDWPDRYIHTNFDTAANIDPTKLKRAAFIAAMTGWYLATMDEASLPALMELLQVNSVARKSDFMRLAAQLEASDAAMVETIRQQFELLKLASIEAFVTLENAGEQNLEVLQQLSSFPAAGEAKISTDKSTIYQRNPEIKGPMSAFGYGYLEDHLPKQQREKLSLLSYRSDWGRSGSEFAYEALNLVNGERSVDDIRHWLMAELGPVPVAYVSDYLAALDSIGVISVVTPSTN